MSTTVSEKESDYIDIEYSGRIKQQYTIEDLFSRIKEFADKEGLLDLWTFSMSENAVSIGFNDGISDDFFIELEKKSFSGEARIDNTESTHVSTLSRLLDLLFSLKPVFSKFFIEDDYCICGSYLSNKNSKLKLIDLDEQQKDYVKKLFNEGYTDHKKFLLMCIAKDMGLKTYNDLYISKYLEKEYYGTREELYEKLALNALETWLYETMEYKKERFCNNSFYDKSKTYEYQALGSVAFDVFSCCNAIVRFLREEDTMKLSFGVRDGKLRNFYYFQVLEIINRSEDLFERCLIAYRYLEGVLDYTNFKYVGPDENMDRTKRYNELVSEKDGHELTLKDAFAFLMK